MVGRDLWSYRPVREGISVPLTMKCTLLARLMLCGGDAEDGLASVIAV